MIPNFDEDYDTAIQDEVTNVPKSDVVEIVNQDETVPQSSETETNTSDEGDAQEVEHRLQSEPNSNVKLREGFEPFPAGNLNIGMNPTIVLPSEEQQKAGFKLTQEELSILNGQFPQYLPLVPKGGTD